MRRTIAVAAALAILAAVNVTIASREAILASGKVVLLELAPVDPRSLMQGDYMALRFRAAVDAFGSVRGAPPPDGYLVVTLSGDGVGTFARVDDGSALRPGEMRLRFRWRDGPKLGTNAYFFEEGRGAQYARARFGEFRVSSDGEMILTGLRDAERRPL